MSHLPRKRRIKAKTDYKARLALLKSGKHRLVIRKTNKYIIVQIVETHEAQDKVIFGASSKILLTKGWPTEKKGSLKSLAACYLTGLFVGNGAKSKVKEAVLDIGLYRNIQKSRIYSALKGAADSGLKISYNESVVPSIEEITKISSLSETFEKVKKNI